MDLHGSVSHRSEVGFGLRLDIAIVERGLIKKVNDELAMTFGGEALFDEAKGKGKDKGKGKGKGKDKDKGKGNGDNALARLNLTLPVAVQWNFIFKRKFSAFPELGLEFPFDDLLSPNFYFAVGGRWHFNPRLALLVRLTDSRVFHLGLTF